MTQCDGQCAHKKSFISRWLPEECARCKVLPRDGAAADRLRRQALRFSDCVRISVGWRLAPYPTCGGGLGAGIALTGCGLEAVRDFCRVAAYPTYGGGLGAGIALTGCGLDMKGGSRRPGKASAATGQCPRRALYQQSDRDWRRGVAMPAIPQITILSGIIVSTHFAPGFCRRIALLSYRTIPRLFEPG